MNDYTRDQIAFNQIVFEPSATVRKFKLMKRFSHVLGDIDSARRLSADELALFIAHRINSKEST